MEVKIKLRMLYGIVIAAMYAALVWLLPGISFGPWQIRVADVLNPLPYVMGFESVLGLTIGTAIANIISQFGVFDIAIGTLCTFVYSIINYAIGRIFGYRKWLLPIIAVIDTIVVGIFIGVILLSFIAGLGEPLYMFISVIPGEFIANIVGAIVIVPIIRRYIAIHSI